MPFSVQFSTERCRLAASQLDDVCGVQLRCFFKRLLGVASGILRRILAHFPQRILNLLSHPVDAHVLAIEMTQKSIMRLSSPKPEMFGRILRRIL